MLKDIHHSLILLFFSIKILEKTPLEVLFANILKINFAKSVSTVAKHYIKKV